MDKRAAAVARIREAKERMDLAQAELDEAQGEWCQACIECDIIEDEEYAARTPTLTQPKRPPET